MRFSFLNLSVSSSLSHIRFLLWSTLLATFVIFANGQSSLQSGLVAWYPFDGNASDMSGNGNHGTVNGATLGTDRHGQANRAYSFDGVDDYIEVFDDDVINFPATSSFSLGLWFNSSGDQLGGITLKNGQYGFKWQGSSSLMQYFDDVYRDSVKNTWNLEKWYFLMMVQTGSQVLLYINDRMDSNSSGMYNPSFVSDSFYIGKHPTFWGAFHGSIDEIRIYDRALSADEVERLYNFEKFSSTSEFYLSFDNVTDFTGKTEGVLEFVDENSFKVVLDDDNSSGSFGGQANGVHITNLDYGNSKDGHSSCRFAS